MSELHEHRLFQLDQVLSLDEVGNHPGSGCGAADNSTILSCVMTSCGKVGVAAISHPSETAAAANSPFFSPPPLVVFSFVPEFKVHWCNWYSEPSLRPVTLTLSTNDDLLLIGCHGGALCAIPFKLFTDTSNVIGSKKVKVVKTSVEAEASRRSRPTSINWWATHEAKALAIVGTQSGHVLLVDLVDGKEIGYVRPSEKPIVKLEQMSDDAQDCSYLFITDSKGKQWRQLIEQKTTGFTWCGANEAASLPKTPTLEKAASNALKEDEDLSSDNMASNSGPYELPNNNNNNNNEEKDEADFPTRSRLAGLKQMSVASLASLKQRLSEGRKAIWDRRMSQQSQDQDQHPPHRPHRSQHHHHPFPNRLTVPETSFNTSSNLPEPLTAKVGSDTLMSVQKNGKGQKMLSGLFPDTAILTMHNIELEVLPQVAYRLPKATDRVLILDKTMLVNSNKKAISVVSAHHAEISLDKAREEPVLQTFVLPPAEAVIGFYKLASFSSSGTTSTTSTSSASNANASSSEVVKNNEAGGGGGGSSSSSSTATSTPTTSSASGAAGGSGGVIQNPCEQLTEEVQKRVNSAKLRGLNMFKPCLIVTSKAVYVLKLDMDPVTTFLECATLSVVGEAEKIATCFELDSKSLFELAADIKLTQKDFASAITLYRLSGCKHLKAVLKFAASGHVQELLSYLSVLFKTPNLEVSNADRIHLSNLALMAYFQQSLAASKPSSAEVLRKRVRSFLDENQWFDECLAVRLAAETREFSLLSHLCVTRGLHADMLAAIAATFSHVLGVEANENVKQLQDCMTNLLTEMPMSERQGLVQCLVHQKDNLATCLAAPALGEQILRILIGLLPLLDERDLGAVVEQCRPDRPDLRPILWPLLENDNDGQKDDNEVNSFALMLVNFFITVQLLYLKKNNATKRGGGCDPDLVKLVVKKSGKNVSSDVTSGNDIACRAKVMATGQAHVLLLRPQSGALLSWGSSQYGVLGHAASVTTRFSTPKPVDFFYQIGAKVKVLAIACGRAHSLALTDCGLYAWGNSKHGQLGLGRQVLMAKKATLIEDLSDEVIVSVKAGQYHSVAMNEKGRVWTWGWGVHGQLGHDSIENEFRPKRLLVKAKVTSISCGYAHTLILTAKGRVMAFGCGLFGQLGNGDNKKSTVPVKVIGLDAKIGTIDAGFFHNFAASEDGQKLWTWGCNPQVLRLEAQQKRKDRMLNKTLSIDEVADTESSSPSGAQSSTGSTGENKHQNSNESAEEMQHLLPALVDTSLFEIDQISCGNQHSLILTKSGTVLSFGRNLDGQLGIASRKEAKLPTLVSGLKDEVIVQISAGGDYSLALSDSGSVFAWGNNNGGQLGKPPLDETNLNKDGTNNKVLVMKSTKRIIRLQHSLQNSCDVPKPVVGITSGVYSNEGMLDAAIQKRYQNGLGVFRQHLATFSTFSMRRGLAVPNPRLRLHVSLESFHRHLEAKKLVKKCVISDNPQAASKISLLDGNLMQAFDFSLQAFVKSGNLDAKDIYNAFVYYLHCDPTTAFSEAEVVVADEDDRQRKIEVKRQLLERLIACWQDQKFSFVQLEHLFLQDADEVLLQILVLTLFCPEEERVAIDCPVIPDDSGPRLSDLFTPEFCLKLGDTFVKTIKPEIGDNPEAVSKEPTSPAVQKWLQKKKQVAAGSENHEDLAHLVKDLVLEKEESK